MPAVMDASAFYNRGCDALTRGDLGGAVLAFRAAGRLEPRAADIQRNLSIAEARVAMARGDAGEGPGPRGHGAAVSSAEAWWLAAVLLAAGAAGMAWRFRRSARIALARRHAPSPFAFLVARRLLDIAGVAGIALALTLLAGAMSEATMPEAVVVRPSLPLTAATGQPLPEAPALVAGERVHIGKEREGLVEVHLEGSVVGWARRSGVWRVRDAARYTPASAAERGDREEKSRE